MDERRKRDDSDEATKGDDKRARVEEEEELPSVRTGKNTQEKRVVRKAVSFGKQPATIAGPSKAKNLPQRPPRKPIR